MEHVSHQLFHVIAEGTPRMKLYGLLAGELDQIQAMRSGKNVKVGIRGCRTQLQRMHSVLQPCALAAQVDLAGDVPPIPDTWDPTLLDSVDLGVCYCT